MRAATFAEVARIVDDFETCSTARRGLAARSTIDALASLCARASEANATDVRMQPALAILARAPLRMSPIATDADDPGPELFAELVIALAELAERIDDEPGTHPDLGNVDTRAAHAAIATLGHWRNARVQWSNGDLVSGAVWAVVDGPMRTHEVAAVVEATPDEHKSLTRILAHCQRKGFAFWNPHARRWVVNQYGRELIGEPVQYPPGHRG